MKRLATFGVGSATYLVVMVGTHNHAVARAGAEAHSVHPNWSARTLCGRAWSIVADPGDDPLLPGQPVLSPDCRACVRALTPLAPG